MRFELLSYFWNSIIIKTIIKFQNLSQACKYYHLLFFDCFSQIFAILTRHESVSNSCGYFLYLGRFKDILCEVKLGKILTQFWFQKSIRLKWHTLAPFDCGRVQADALTTASNKLTFLYAELNSKLAKQSFALNMTGRYFCCSFLVAQSTFGTCL